MPPLLMVCVALVVTMSATRPPLWLALAGLSLIAYSVTLVAARLLRQRHV